MIRARNLIQMVHLLGPTCTSELYGKVQEIPQSESTPFYPPGTPHLSILKRLNSDKDDKGNACKGDVLALDTRNSLIMADSRLVATLGIEDLVVVSGTARVTNGEKSFLVTENQSTYIPVGQVHALENPGTIPLELIEVQSGSYLGEDDIVRLEDRYGRVE
jgi:hypothetical protein